MDGGGAGAARADGDWLHVYGRVVAMLPRVDALAAGRARLEAVNALQHEFWEARDALLQHRLLQAEESRGRWEAAYIDLQPPGDDPKFTELQVSDLEDLTTFVDVLAAENTEFQIKAGEVDAGAENSQNAAGHGITRDLEAELRNLKQAYEAVCSEKDKEVCALKQNIEQLQVASQKKDGEIHRLRTRAKAAEAKRRLVQGKLQNMCSLTKEIGGVIEMCKDRQRETSQTRKKDMSETQKKSCSEGPAVRVETKNDSSKQMLAKGGQPEAIQKRKCLAFLLDNDEQNGNDCQMTDQVVEPPKKKRVSGRNEVEKENNKEVASSKVHSESNRSPHKLAIYNALVYLRSVKDNFKNKPEKHREFQAAQSGFLSRKSVMHEHLHLRKFCMF
uniref:Uncharacterized protein n=1 Tax=Avena sativa TaxID=4498 RepID=A0ACD5UH15_AVESA